MHVCSYYVCILHVTPSMPAYGIAHLIIHMLFCISLHYLMYLMYLFEACILNNEIHAHTLYIIIHMHELQDAITCIAIWWH